MNQIDLDMGLTAAQVRERARGGLLNAQPARGSRSAARIVADNLFTFFNLINAVLGALVLSVGSYKNALFLLVILLNTAIGIVQALRAKRTLDRLSLLGSARVDVVRDGRTARILPEEVALDDIMVLGAGGQIVADAVVRAGFVEVNESLLTGEADAVPKGPGDPLMSGSYVVAGAAKAQATAVGADAYAAKLAAEAKAFKRHPSPLRDALNRILKFVSFAIVPLGAGFFLRQYLAAQVPWRDAMVGAVAAVLGMIPEGLVLLTSIALAAGAVNLGRRNALVRELFSIEMLARVDAMCLDKTGTLTEGVLRVTGVIPLADAPIDGIAGALAWALPDGNETLAALRRRFAPADAASPSAVLPFSSARKYSGARFDGRGAYLIGAYEFLVPPGRRDPALEARIGQYADEGARVLALASGEVEDLERAPEADLRIVALVLLGDAVRAEAADALRYFREQGTDLLILSGDHPRTVAAIARAAGFPGADRCVDATTLGTPAEIEAAAAEYSIFGRVQPAQKKEIVRALRRAGKTVAMVGDGVNDVPALKEADCSIAMARGADAAKQCANIVLLDSNFLSMPGAVNEGRRVINNIQSAASLFLVKTLFSMILTAVLIASPNPYPFLPIHLTLISSCAVGIPTFVFALQPNFRRISEDFFGSVLTHALSGALTIVLFIFVSAAAAAALGLSQAALSTMATITTGITSLHLISRVYPIEGRLRALVYRAVFAVFLGALLLLRDFLQLGALGYEPAVLVVAMTVAARPTLDRMNGAAARILRRIRRP